MSATKKISLVDSHCHLDLPALYDDLDNVISAAFNNSIQYLQTISTQLKEINKIRKIAEDYANIFFSVGNHPLNLETEGVVSCEKIIDLCVHRKATAIGETGLDYHYSKNKVKIQQDSFIEHIKAAQITGLPIIVHTRNAENDTIDILTKMYKKKHFNGVIHCFTASDKFAVECLKIGLYISASGIVTFKNAKNIADVFQKTVPLERILVETDAPYLAPVPLRGEKNQPANLVHTAKFMANLLEIDYYKLCEKTTENYFDLFSKAAQS